MTQPLPDSCSGHFKKNLNGKFKFLDSSAVSVPRKYITYTPPRIVKTKNRWYIEFYYRIPDEIKKNHDNKKWGRQRIFENINRFKTQEYAELLLKAVNQLLQDGYNPYEDELEEIYTPQSKKQWSLNYALDQYMEHCKEKGLRPKSLQTYGTTVNSLKEYFFKDNKIYEPITSFTKEDIKGFLRHIKKKNGLVNSTYNNYLTSTGTIFNWFVEEERLEKNPAEHIECLPVKVTKHKYYDTKTAEAIKQTLSKNDPYLLKFCEFIYYSGVRPKSEARFLQVKHILFDRGLLFIPAEVSKNKKDGYVTMCDELKELLEDLVKDKPGDYYIFGKHGTEKEPASQNYFSARFKPYKDKLGLKDETIYSFKHSRAIALAEAGANPYEIMKLFRHSSLEQTIIYLRDLGCNISDEVNKKTRKF